MLCRSLLKTSRANPWDDTSGEGVRGEGNDWSLKESAGSTIELLQARSLVRPKLYMKSCSTGRHSFYDTEDIYTENRA